MRQRMKKPILIFLLALFIGAVVLTIIIDTVGFNAPEFKIFADMNELSFLDQYCVGQLDDDESITEGLSIADRKCIEVEYNGNRFRVYAYVFLNNADAKEYFERLKPEMGKNGWHYRIYQSNKAFFACGPRKGRSDFRALLYEHFSVTVEYLT